VSGHNLIGGDTVKYMFLLWQNESAMPAPGTPDFEKQVGAFDAFYGDASGKGAFQTGDPFQASTTGQTVRVRAGKTDAAAGPFSTGSDQLIGFYVLDCKDDEDARGWAAKIPTASTGAIEVRPVLAL
jgi:hypothetical protein